MDIRCRPMETSDFGVVESVHWTSADQVTEYQGERSIASMLAFSGTRYLGQLYVQEYDPVFADPGGWVGHRPWADFRVAEPLDLEGRYLTLGCYHVGWRPNATKDPSLWGWGIGAALLTAVVEWRREQRVFNGLLTWALAPGWKKLLQEAGQMPYTVYERFGFQEIKQVSDPRWNPSATRYGPGESEEDLRQLRVMRLSAREGRP